jgi:aspartokinase
MITIGELVNTYLKNHPYIEQGIENDLINYSSLARQIKPQIEKELMKRIEVSAVGMALRRAAKHIQKKKSAYPVIRPEELIVRSGIVEYTFEKSETVSSCVAAFLHATALEKKYFSVVTEGVFEVAVIMSTQYEGKAKEIFKKEKITSRQDKISAITLRLPTNNVVVPGVYHRFLQKLAWENINIIDLVSTLTEFTILLSEDEVDRAFRLLKE